MKDACEKWKDPLRESALTGATPRDLEEHLRGCAKCSAEMDEVRARAARLEALLPLVAQGAEPSADFTARVLAAAGEGKRARSLRIWTLAGAAAAVVVVLMMGVNLQRRTARMIPVDELAAAQKLAEWRAPSDGLLVTPGQEILRTTPRLGESYLNVPVKMDEEE